MGISIQAFRIQIGIFHSIQCSPRNIKVQKLPRLKLKVHKCRKLVFCVVAVVLLIIQSSFQWSQQGVKQNKLCKIIHGNRRSLGYKCIDHVITNAVSKCTKLLPSLVERLEHY